MAGFDVGSVKAKIEADITNFQQGIREAKAEVSGLQSGLSSAGTAIASFGKQAAIFTGVAAAGIGVVAKKALDMAGNFEQSEIAFTTLLKDRQKAIAAIKDIEEDAKKTPYNLPDLIRANQLLISAGVATKDARTDIINLGNAIAATGGGTAELNRLSVNLQQIKAVGKASALDVKQFAFAGINVYKLLADSTGKTVEQVREMDITYEMLSESFAKASASGGLFEGAMEDQSKSLQGLMSNLQDVIGLTLKDIAINSGLFDVIKNGVAALIPLIQQAGEAFANWLANLKNNETFIFFVNTLTSGMQMLGTWISENQELVLTFLQGLAIGLGALMIIGTITSLIAALTNPLTLVVLGIAALYTAWQTNFLGIRDITMAVVNAVVWFWQTVLQPAIQYVYDTFVFYWNGIQAVTEFLWSGIKFLFDAGKKAVENSWLGMLIKLVTWVVQHWDQIVATIQKGWNMAKSIFDSALSFLGGWGGRILDALVSPFVNAWNRIQDLVKKIRDAMDFTERHSPSIMDVLNKSIRLVNSAMGKFDFAPLVDQLSLPSVGVMDLTGQIGQVAPQPVSNNTRIINQNIQATLTDGLDVNTFAEQLSYKYRNENL